MTTDDVLLKCGLVDSQSLERAREVQRRDGLSLSRAIASLGIADEEVVAAALAKGLRLEYVSPGNLQPDTDLLNKFTADYCHKALMLPLGSTNRGLRVAMANPLDYSTIQAMEFKFGKSLVVLAASETAILAHLVPAEALATEATKTANLLSVVNPAGELEAVPQPEHELVNPEELAKDTKTPAIIRLVNMVLSEAVSLRASDIHIEPQETFVQVRYRVDGILRDAMQIPRHLQESMISRVKLISGADIAERRKPQDGRARLRYEGRRVDMRVSTLPTQFGEKVVIRLLDNNSGPRGLEDLDFTADHLTTLRSLLSRSQGMILVTGPTGSGKTSTLYSALDYIKSPTTNIITVEDPIEIQLPGINQVQVNPRIGVTFAIGLRSILRQDPNVILVGEIRDTETAAIACQASQTGHLLLSTLHTNDGPATISRLVDLKVEPFLVAASLIGIIAQRLVRKTCQACKAPKAPTEEALQKSGAASIVPDPDIWTAGAGCTLCGNSGFVGRIAVHELLVVDEEIRELISNKAPEHVVRKVARQHGMKTMMEDAVLKAAAGLTTLDEVIRNVAAPDILAHSVPPPVLTDEIFDHPPRVLVVEDSITISTVVKYFMELDGFEVTIADDGAKGLMMAQSERPDLIISDIQMPGLDGLSMLRALRADPNTMSIPVMMLTAESNVDTETQGLQSGADDYILKPVEPRRLAARARALLARARSRA